MNEQFEMLAAKVLAGEASAQEADELRALLAIRPDLNAEFIQLQQTSQLIEDSAPILAELDRVREERIPPARRRELADALRAQFPARLDPKSSRPAAFWRLFLRPVWLAAACVLIALSVL